MLSLTVSFVSNNLLSDNVIRVLFRLRQVLCLYSVITGSSVKVMPLGSVEVGDNSV